MSFKTLLKENPLRRQRDCHEWVAQDACDVLGIKNASDTISEFSATQAIVYTSLSGTKTHSGRGFGPPSPKSQPKPQPQQQPELELELPEQDETVSQNLYWSCLNLLADIRWSSQSTALLKIIHDTLETVAQSNVVDKKLIQ